MVEAKCGSPAVGIELRQEQVSECKELAKNAGVAGKCAFIVGDMRYVGKALDAAKKLEGGRKLKRLMAGGFGGASATGSM